MKLAHIPLVLIGLSLVGCGSGRDDVEQPKFKEVLKDGDFSIREYPEMTLAQAKMGEDGQRNGVFGKLFRYIDSGNAEQQKIEMTSPVLIDTEEKDEDFQPEAMSFILPADVAAKGGPAPDNEDVTLVKIPATTYAVYSYSGEASTKLSNEGLTKLREWLAKNHPERKIDGEPRFAYYDPPWTPNALRLNEVLLPLKAEKKE